MERDNRPGLTLFSEQPLDHPGAIALAGEAAQHARVRRVRVGDPVRVVDGRGGVATGRFHTVERREVVVEAERVDRVPRPSALDVIVPVADKDRMLLAAEKCVELQVTGWRPALFARSRSVAPRGEGERFQERVLARMRSALEQSGGAWLPELHPDAESPAVFASVATTAPRLVLDVSGETPAPGTFGSATAIAVGPEGGWAPDELDQARTMGWTVVALTRTTLRFETAIIAGAALVRASQLTPGRPSS